MVPPSFLKLIIIASIVGGMCGIAGAAVTTIFLTDYAGWVAGLSLPASPAGSSGRIDRPRGSVVSSGEVETIREKVSGSAVGIYQPDRTNLLRMYRPDRALASGVVLTSDGWLLVPAISSVDLSKMEFVVGRMAYQADRVEQGTRYPFGFVKVTAQNLPVVAFGKGLEVSVGDQVFVVPSRQTLLSTSVFDMRFGTELVRSSDVLARRWFLSEPPAFPLLGSPVVDASGSLVGMIETIEGSRPRVLPIEAVVLTFQTLLQNGTISYPMLGVRGVDLSRAIGLSKTIPSRGMENGFLEYGKGSVSYVSSAKSAGIAEGDIILSVEGQALGYRKSLDEYLVSFRPGDEVALRIDRAGKQMDVRVMLGSDRP